MLEQRLLSRQEIPFSREDLTEKITRQPFAGRDGIRMLFLPSHLTEDNADEVCYVYRQIMDTSYDTVLIVEPGKDKWEKKIPVFPGSSVVTAFGSVPVDEKLRDDLCDEEDDFFIRDVEKKEHPGFYDHVAMLQLVQNDFKVVGLQLTDETPPIVQELTFVIKEILPFKNALTIFCCEMPVPYRETFDIMVESIRHENDTRLLNMIYSGESKIRGAGVFLAGVMAARHREREIRFIHQKPAVGSPTKARNLLTGYAGFPEQSRS